MAHFAIIDENNIVINVITVSNSILLDENGNENEQLGETFLRNLLGSEVVDHLIKQTSYNNNFRKMYAGAGMQYFPDLDIFHHQKPYPSWTMNTTTHEWEAPIPYPTDGNNYNWNEETQTWDQSPST